MNEKKCALICGISGQDGAYLASFLLNKGYAVYGTSRDAQMSPFQNLVRLGIRDKVKLESVALNDFRSVLQVLMKVQPDEVYNLAGQSSVGLSFHQPVETLESISVGTLNLLRLFVFLQDPLSFTTLVQVNVLAMLGKDHLMKPRRSCHVVPMRLRRLRHSGKWPTTARLMVCMHAPEFFLIMNHRCVRNALSQRRLLLPHAEYLLEVRSSFTSGIWLYSAIGDGRRNMLRQCG